MKFISSPSVCFFIFIGVDLFTDYFLTTIVFTSGLFYIWYVKSPAFELRLPVVLTRNELLQTFVGYKTFLEVLAVFI